MNDLERYWGKVDTSGECWMWRGFRNPKGYGTFWWKERKRMASHAAWDIAHGSLPPIGLRVLHHCDNPPCVRPSHLFLGTPLDNMRDMIAKGRERHPIRYGLRTWHKLTEDDVRSIRAAYASGGMTQEALASQYRVSRRLIGGIVSGKRWRSVV